MRPNNTIRIISDNVADTATITVANTATGAGADNLKTDIKGDVCRVLSGTAEIVVSWPAATSVGGVVIPASNLGPSSTIRVRAFEDDAETILLADTGVRNAAPGASLMNWNFTQPLNSNQFAFSFPPITATYFSQHVAARKLRIDIYDPAAEFIDLSRLIAGAYFSPKCNPSYGQVNGILDLSVNSRAASGDLKTDAGPRARTMLFNLDHIDNAHRAQVQRIMEMGIGRFMFISIMPEDVDPVRERDKSIYGKVSQPISMRWGSFSEHAAEFNFEGF